MIKPKKSYTTSIRIQDSELITWYQSKPNKSTYIRELIYKDKFKLYDKHESESKVV